MLLSRKQKVDEEVEMQMTPMIDIVFQLLIFFLLSAKFIALEGQLSAYLPKDRGLEASDPISELVNVTLFLQWLDEGPGGRVRCLTLNYLPPEGGPTQRQYEFPVLEYTGPIPYGPGGDLIDFGYAVPDFAKIEEYLRFRKETYAEAGGSGKGLPVIVNFEDKVPSQMVVTILDICKRVGIEDFTIAAKEEPY